MRNEHLACDITTISFPVYLNNRSFSFPSCRNDEVFLGFDIEFLQGKVESAQWIPHFPNLRLRCDADSDFFGVYLIRLAEELRTRTFGFDWCLISQTMSWEPSAPGDRIESIYKVWQWHWRTIQSDSLSGSLLGTPSSSPIKLLGDSRSVHASTEHIALNNGVRCENDDKTHYLVDPQNMFRVRHRQSIKTNCGTHMRKNTHWKKRKCHPNFRSNFTWSWVFHFPIEGKTATRSFQLSITLIRSISTTYSWLVR